MPNNESSKSQEEVVVWHSWNSWTTLEPIDNEISLSVRESNKIQRSKVTKEEEPEKSTWETELETSSRANDVKPEKQQEVLSLDNQIDILEERIKVDWLFQQWELYLSKKKIDAAIESFSKIITDYPYSDKAPKSHIRLWEIYIGEKEYYKASEILKEFVNDNRDSPELTNVCFLLAEALFAQYDHEIWWTKLALNEARANYEKVLKNSTSWEFFDKAKKRLIDCEQWLADNDFFAIDLYNKIGRYRAALKRLKCMRVDFAWNEKIIKEINKREPDLLKKYKEQTEELGKIQMRQLKQNLVEFWQDRQESEKNLPILESELSELESKIWTISEKDMKSYKEQLNKKRNKVKLLKQKIETLGRDIIQAVGFIDDLNTIWYNPDLVPGKPDPNKKTLRIWGGAEFELEWSTFELYRSKSELEKNIFRLENELSELEGKIWTTSKKDMKLYEEQLDIKRNDIKTVKQKLDSISKDIIQVVGIAVGSNTKPFTEIEL